MYKNLHVETIVMYFWIRSEEWLVTVLAVLCSTNEKIHHSVYIWIVLCYTFQNRVVKQRPYSLPVFIPIHFDAHLWFKINAWML